MTPVPGVAGCRAALRTGSRSFAAAGLLLPRAVLDPAAVLYAFCRAADDAVDGAAPENKAEALAVLRLRLDAVYAGHAVGGGDQLLAAVLATHGVPRSLPDALLAGFAADVAGQRYPDLPSLHGYAMQVAGSVGAMMALLMGVRAPDALAAAAELGCAMQLTNIARDVGEDARCGRLYLPLDWLREAGIDADAWLDHPAHSPALARVVGRLLCEADRLYASAGRGIPALPPRCRPAIRAAARIYRAIGTDLARHGCDPLARRAVVPGWRKLLLALPGLLPAVPRLRWWRRLDDRLGTTVDLFIRLAEADRARLPRGARHAERQQRLHPGRGEAAEVDAFVHRTAALPR